MRDQRTPEQRVRDRVSRRMLIGWDDARALLDELDALRKELERYRKTATIGGPPPKVTPCWEPGDSSRPSTAPPEEISVALPVSDEEAETMPSCTCRGIFSHDETCPRWVLPH